MRVGWLLLALVACSASSSYDVTCVGNTAECETGDTIVCVSENSEREYVVNNFDVRARCDTSIPDRVYATCEIDEGFTDGPYLPICVR